MQNEEILAKMKKEIFFRLLILLLLMNFVLAYVIFMKNTERKLLNLKITEFQTKDKYHKLKIEYYHGVINWLQAASKIDISPSFILQNEIGDSIQISNLVNGATKLVFRYSELNCNVCIDSQMDFVKGFIEKNGYDSFIMISDYNYHKNLLQFKTFNNIQNEIYNVATLDSSLDRLNIPYYFILDKYFRPRMFFFPEKNLPADTKEYFRKIDEYFNVTNY
jgi:hypothetical protein